MNRGADAVSERRLRPVYDYLDTGNNKKAVHEADKVLKKQRDNACAKALKALAFLRMGRGDESKDLVWEVLKDDPADEPTLQAMSICLREMNRADMIIRMFESALKSKPNSEEILSQLFMSYVRIGDFKKQKEIALQLYKTKEHTPFYLWAVMSVVMQAQSPEGEKLSKVVLLPMAERMIKKLVNEDKIEESGEVELLLMILELQDKFEEALAILKGPLGTKLSCESFQREIRISNIHKKLGNFPELNAIFRRLFRQRPDDWLLCKEYLQTVFTLIEKKWEPQEDYCCMEGDVDYTLEAAADVVRSLRDAEDDHAHQTVNGAPAGDAPPPPPPKLRGPLLCQLEFLRQAKENGVLEPALSLSPAPRRLLFDFFSRFGDKGSFFADAKTWLPMLDADEIEILVAEIGRDIGAEKLGANGEKGIALPSTLRDLNRHLNWTKLWFYSEVASSLEEEDLRSIVAELVARHRHGLRFGENLRKTEIQFSDDYLLLGAHLLLMMANRDSTHFADFVFQVIVLLEGGLSSSESNFQFRLLLSRLYTKLGAFQISMSHFDELDVKHIQHDTLGHYWLTHAASQGHYARATILHNQALKFFSANFRDTSEYLIQAYRFASFAKIPEFLRLRDRLTNSLQYSIVYAESMILDLILDASSHADTERKVSRMALDPVADQTDWDLVHDNRDLLIMADWNASTIRAADQRRARAFEHEKAWAKLRHATHNVVSAAILLSCGGGVEVDGVNAAAAANGEADVLPPEPKTKEKTRIDAGIFRRLIEEFESHVEFCRRRFKDKEEEEEVSLIHPLYSSPPSRLFNYLRFDLQLVFVLDSLRVAEYLLGFSTPDAAALSKDTIDEKMEHLLRTGLADSFKAAVDQCRQEFDPPSEDPARLVHNDIYLHDLSVTVEALAFAVALLGACHKVLKPLKNSLSKKAKKKKGGGGDASIPPTFANFAAGVGGLKTQADELSRHMGIVSERLTVVVGAEALNRLSLVQKEEEEEEVTNGGRSSRPADIIADVHESYKTSTEEMGALLQKKLAYLASLSRL